MAGRFGWKAGQPTVRQQSVGALHDDMGITSPDVPENCHNQGSLCTVEPGADDEPEMSATDMDDQVFYNRTIAVPIARNVDDAAVVRGANRFVDVGCSSCHTTTQRSGDDEIAGLAGQTLPHRSPTCSSTTWATVWPTVVPSSRRRGRMAHRPAVGPRPACGDHGVQFVPPRRVAPTTSRRRSSGMTARPGRAAGPSWR